MEIQVAASAAEEESTLIDDTTMIIPLWFGVPQLDG